MKKLFEFIYRILTSPPMKYIAYRLMRNKKLGKLIRKKNNEFIKYLYLNFYSKDPVTQNKTIIFASYLGLEYSCNPKALYETMLKDPKYDEYNFVWVFKKKALKNEEIKQTTPFNDHRTKVVRYVSLDYFKALSDVKYWVFNSKLPRYVIKKDHQVYLQTWHGTPLKRLAYDIEVPEGTTFYRSGMSQAEMLSTYDIDVARYDYFLSSSKYATEKFLSSFRLPKAKILEYGYPRNEILLNHTSTQVNAIKLKYKIPLNKKVILYAPTWRDNHFNHKGYLFTLKVDFDKWYEKLGDDYVVVFKPHYLISNNFKFESDHGFIVDGTKCLDINELYLISDILITDYSSVFFDYALLNRPIYYYMYDIEEYQNKLRGFYIDIDKELPGLIFTNENELLMNIKNGISKEISQEFKDKYCILDKEASSKILDIFLKTKKEINYV